MSTFYPAQLPCPKCQKSYTADLVQGIHISRLPHARQQILDGTFQLFRCPHCGGEAMVEAALVYTDFDRDHYVAMEPSTYRDRPGALKRHMAVFNDCLVYAPPIARDLGRRLKRRLVFGLRALREKLLLWDAGMDDRVVESLKGDWLEENDLAVEEVVLRLHVILPGGHLLFAVLDPPPALLDDEGDSLLTLALPAPRDFATIPHEKYRQRLEEAPLIPGKYPWLGEDWYVDIYRR